MSIYTWNFLHNITAIAVYHECGSVCLVHCIAVNIQFSLALLKKMPKLFSGVSCYTVLVERGLCSLVTGQKIKIVAECVLHIGGNL